MLLLVFVTIESFEVVVVKFVVVVVKPSEGCADRLLKYCLAFAMAMGEGVSSDWKLPQHPQLPQPSDSATERSECSKRKAVISKTNVKKFEL